MTPDSIAALSHLLAIFRTMSGWPFGVLLFLVMVGPWMMAMMLAWFQSRRFESVVKMYKSNVRLVEDYQKVCTQQENLSKELKDIIVLNTRAMTELVDNIRGNQFCPKVRLKKEATGVEET